MACRGCGCFYYKLALNSAPSLLGVKAASLMSLYRQELDVYANADSFNRKASCKGLKIKILCECDKRCLVLVYNTRLLSQLLCEPDRRRVLARYGYKQSFSLTQCLDRLASRCKKTDAFPHEIGIFLDYPVEDVEGFINNKGAGYKLCGYWKVYGDEEKARCTFAKYDKCRRFLCNKLNEGIDLYRILKIS